jgi:hypothetical protein
MLLPGPATVAPLIKKIPEHKLAATHLLCKELTHQFKIKGTCPVTTRKALEAIAHDSSEKIAYWRVISANGGLFSRFPGGLESQAAQFEKRRFYCGMERESTQGKILQRKPRSLALTRLSDHGF